MARRMTEALLKRLGRGTARVGGRALRATGRGIEANTLPVQKVLGSVGALDSRIKAGLRISLLKTKAAKGSSLMVRSGAKRANRKIGALIKDLANEDRLARTGIKEVMEQLHEVIRGFRKDNLGTYKKEIKMLVEVLERISTLSHNELREGQFIAAWEERMARYDSVILMDMASVKRSLFDMLNADESILNLVAGDPTHANHLTLVNHCQTLANNIMVEQANVQGLQAAGTAIIQTIESEIATVSDKARTALVYAERLQDMTRGPIDKAKLARIEMMENSILAILRGLDANLQTIENEAKKLEVEIVKILGYENHELEMLTNLEKLEREMAAIGVTP